MIKKSLKWLLSAIGIGAIILFIWKGWGESGNISGFFLMIWDWFYAVTDGIVQAARQAIGQSR